MTRHKTYRDAIRDLEAERDRLQASSEFQDYEIRFVSFVRAIGFLKSKISKKNGKDLTIGLSPEAKAHLVKIGRIKPSEDKQK